ncbi:Glutamyl-tRNA amidotransferase subunit E protein [Marine Group I thaumarchaeote SCGC RSA3]|uniref:Glutamyl-tRNA amidotransferase subunit E protein n=1 Tax=Marine Group I thaumarchaeote SCGC RSA3 TaxID=1503183 RepID=A0A087S3X7_9ARCH|nr:Glutamyl-tRNA amidotransferase subunit E protein [Marine Group I thaumarchaeote SCGC RSA3]
MSEFSIDELGVKVGLEIHQQLATNKKLFCNCTPIDTDEYSIKFQRKLRAAKSELGEYDPAALFEKSKSKTIMYFANPESSCLVEQDEEPPHELDIDAKNISLIIASALKSDVFREIYPMRKTVVDGSNTTGFQRTMLISQGGSFNVEEKEIGIQSICLEEDAAKILGEDGAIKKYGLERLGIPLVEIATEPFEVKPHEIKKIALALGRILRSTKKVKRGLGSIRQDVNVSIKDGNVVIEVKGVQQLDQLEKVVEYEAKRQHGLLKISKKLQEIDWTHNEKDRKDVTELFLKKILEINGNDGFLILAAPEEKISVVIDQIILRIEYIRNEGIPIDTRLATQNGETKFLRPRPGAARMYPETDIPPIIISNRELEDALNNIPKSWDDSIKDLQIKYQLNLQLSEQLFDSSYFELFEKITKKTKVNPTFVASVLCSTIINLERNGLDSKLLKNEEITIERKSIRRNN